MASRLPRILSTHPAPAPIQGATTTTASYRIACTSNGLIGKSAHSATQPLATDQVKKLSTSARLFSPPPTPTNKQNTSTQDTASNSPSSPSDPKNENHDEMRVNFGDLGMTRIAKFVVFAVIGVLSTMETIFWCNVAWRWWKGDEGEGDSGNRAYKTSTSRNSTDSSLRVHHLRQLPPRVCGLRNSIPPHSLSSKFHSLAPFLFFPAQSLEGVRPATPTHYLSHPALRIFRASNDGTGPADPESSLHCIICDKPASKRCDQCMSTAYCSEQCQRGDFEVHNLLCEQFASFDLALRPSQDHIRAIVFHVDRKKPEFIWLRSRWRHSHASDDGIVERLLLRYGMPDVTVVHTNLMLSRRLRPAEKSAVLHCPNASLYNRSVQCITHTGRGVPPYPDWCGLIVAHGIDERDEGLRCRDVNMNDFRHIADTLIAFKAVSMIPSVPGELLPVTSQDVKGIRINCLGDQVRLNKSPMEQISIYQGARSFYEEHTSHIAARIELPIITQRCYPHPVWATDTNLYVNQDATYLYLSCDPDAVLDPLRDIFGWAYASQEYQNPVGTVIAVRQDGKPLSVEHMEALCSYCYNDALETLWQAIPRYDGPRGSLTKEQALSRISKKSFAAFWSQWCEDKREQGGCGRCCVSL
ncbi:hypothetical protein F5Y18DRAFT_422163 [Xylariaceae sp. FL1019]|nr:hypothetical protein F5Y18DRAFT_422163 [Xylariaceae sp. FL1019]